MYTRNDISIYYFFNNVVVSAVALRWTKQILISILGYCIPMYGIVIRLVSCETTSKVVLKLDILHLYILKSVGHCTLLLSICNLNSALFGESMFPVAEARFCNVESFHSTVGVCPGVTDTKVSNVLLEFFCSCMKNTELSCEGLVMEHTMTKSVSL